MQYLITADDLTGANDSAAQLARCGLSTAVVISPFDSELNQDYAVTVLDTESRDLPVQAACDAVASAYGYIAEKIGQATIFKKVDSTLRGHVGAELETLIRCCKPDVTVFAPAFPEAGRTTIDGYQLLNGIRLEKTELARIPKSPVNTSYIPQILQRDSALKPVLIKLDQLRSSALELNALIEKKITAGHRLFIVDAQIQSDLELAVRAFRPRGKVLFAGSAGLAKALSPAVSTVPEAAAAGHFINSDNKQHKVQRLLYLSGSISAVSQKQCRVLTERSACPVFKLKPQGALTDPKAEAARVFALLQAQAADANAVLVSGALSDEDVQCCRSCAEKLGISFFEAGERYALTMAALMERCAPYFDGYVMTGGDTAVHACRAVRATAIAVEGEIESGIARCVIAAGSLAGRTLVTKAGAFGNDQTFYNVYQHLISNEGR